MELSGCKRKGYRWKCTRPNFPNLVLARSLEQAHRGRDSLMQWQQREQWSSLGAHPLTPLAMAGQAPAALLGLCTGDCGVHLPLTEGRSLALSPQVPTRPKQFSGG